jgi:aspartate kinase
LSAKLDADICEIYTDVNGVYTAVPRLVEEASKLSGISYEELLEMASLGAQVLHPRSIEFAKEYNINLVVRSSFNHRSGTHVKEVEEMENIQEVSGVVCSIDDVKISLMGIPYRPGIASQIFNTLAKENININVIIQNVSQEVINDITFTIDKEDLNQAKAILKELEKELTIEEIEFDSEIAIVSIVGAGMITSSGVASNLFEALGEEDINIEMISTSEIKISCLIDKNKAQEAVKAIHNKFNLGDKL